MLDVAREWFERNSSTSAHWSATRLVALKQRRGERVSVVIPARNEQSSVGAVVSGIRADLVEGCPLVDEILVMDSMSTDATVRAARDAGAAVHSVRDVRPDLGAFAGKGEALWKSQFVATGSMLVFIDADLTQWGTHFVTGLLGPLLAHPDVLLVRGFYDRLLDIAPGTRSTEGGRVTELVARPLIATRWPELAAVVQPLAGEWAIRRETFERLHVPRGYGIELATLLDVWREHGLDGIAQVDLGARGHRHQTVHDLAVMATQILHAADVRAGLVTRNEPDSLALAAFTRAPDSPWTGRRVDVAERPPGVSVPSAAAGRPC